MTLKPIFAWYDCWIGFYFDRQKRALYFFPVPMIGIVLRLKPKEPSE